MLPHQSSPSSQPLHDSYAQLWQLYLKLGLNVHLLCVQLHATVIENIFLWQAFCTAFRFGKKTQTVKLSISAPSDLTTSEFCHVQSKTRYHIRGQLWGAFSACDQTEFAGLKDLAKAAKRQSSGTTFRGEVCLSSTGSP